MQIDYEFVDREKTALGLLELRRYSAETGETGYEILIDGDFLMASHGSHSERAMARLAWQRLPAPRSRLKTLIGGLGAGHTLRATLNLDGIEQVVVAEIGRKVVDWNRSYFATVNDNAIDDPRVAVEITDVADLIRATASSWDIILLDVDNGPGWLASPSNDHLYSTEGLQTCLQALRPNGVLAIWSPDRNTTLEDRLNTVFPEEVDIEETSDIARTENEPRSIIYCAIKPGLGAGRL